MKRWTLQQTIASARFWAQSPHSTPEMFIILNKHLMPLAPATSNTERMLARLRLRQAYAMRQHP